MYYNRELDKRKGRAFFDFFRLGFLKLLAITHATLSGFGNANIYIFSCKILVNVLELMK